MTSAAPVPSVPEKLLRTAREVAHETADETFRPQTLEVWADDWNVAETEEELAEYREVEGHGAPLYSEVVEPVYEDDVDEDEDDDEDDDEYSWFPRCCPTERQLRASADRTDLILSDPFYERPF